MFRGAVVLLLGVIGLALAAVAYQGWQVQRVMADQLAAVSDDLGELAREQTDWIRAQQDPTRHEIRGRVFRGDPTRPAADVEITVRQLPTLAVVRRLRSDASGTFRTGRLQAGDYCVLAPLVGDVKNPSLAWGDEKVFPGASQLHPFYAVQSRPLTVPDDDLTAELDVDLPVGTIELAMDDPVPAAVGAEEAIPLVLNFSLVPLDQATLPWRLDDELPGAWPQRGYLAMPIHWGLRTRFFGESPAPWSIDLGERLVGERGALRAGRYWFVARCGVSNALLMGMAGGGGFGGSGNVKVTHPEASEVQRLRTLLSRMRPVFGILGPDSRSLPREAPPGATVITLRPGGHLRLKVAAPADYLAHLEKVLTMADPSDDDVDRLLQSEPLRVTIEELPATTP